MFLSRLAQFFRVETLVYQYAGAGAQCADLPEGFAWHPATEASVRKLFAQDSPRRRRFLRFLRSGWFGFFLAGGDEWITYGWCTPPATPHPPHLPRWAGGLGAYWIFYCHTREEFRGKGHYQRLLSRLVCGAYQRAGAPLVLCDTLPGNLASRRAVIKAGFSPAGVLEAFRPVRGLVIGGGWQREAMHVPLLRTQSGEAGEQAA